MAKHKRRGRSRFFAYPIDHSLALATLANGIVLSDDMTNFGVTKVYCISADLSWSVDDQTVGEGPLVVGLNSGDLSVTEIAEKLDAKPVSQTDRIAMERSRRPVRNTGRFSGAAVGETLNDGQPIRTPLKFILDTGIELALWVRNKSGATLTTGTVVRVTGTLYMRWM